MIYTLTINPSIDQHITIKKLIKDDKIKAEKIRRDPGGKGINVSRVIKELGGDTKVFGIVGGCAGYMLRDLLDRSQIEHKFCEILGETRINFILTDLSDRSQTRISAPGPQIDAGSIDHLIYMTEHITPRPSYWVLGGSLPPGVPKDTYKKLIEHFQSKKEKCVLDADEEPLKLGIEANPYLIKPNEFELERLVGRKCKNDREFLVAGRSLSQRGVGAAAISLGARGAIIITKDKAWRLEVRRDVEVKSKVGAGDSFVGGLLTALDKGKDLEVAARWAVAAGTAAVMKEGTQLCQRKDVENLFKMTSLKPLS